MLLLDLSNELFLCIGETLQPVDLKRFLQTNRRLSLLLSSVLHKIAAHTRLRSGLSVIHWAAARRYTALIGTLISYGSDINAMVLSTGWTPLHHSIAVGDEETVKFLLDKGAKIDLGVIYFGYEGIATALHIAADRGLDRIAGLLLERGADINAGSRYGDTPLHLAVRKEHEAVVKLLLKNHADIECKGTGCYTALHHAVRMKIFVPWTELNTEDLWKTSLPSLPVNHQRIRIITALLEAGADIAAKNTMRETSLHLAAKCDHSGEIVTLLLNYGAAACIEHRNRSGESPIHLAIRGRYSRRIKEVKRILPVKALLEKVTHLDLQDHSGATALHLAASLGHVEISRELLDRGASVAIQDGDLLRTALHHVFEGASSSPAKSGYLAVARLLVERGADIHAEWLPSRTVSYWPQRDKRLVDFVEEMGMDPPDYVGGDGVDEEDASS